MRKIMIVDDDTTSLAIGRAFLDDEYEISLMRSGLQALGALQEGVLPDLILLDVLMPGMNGMEVLQAIKKDNALKEIPVIFLTGEREVNLEVDGYSNGASDFLQKPVNKFLLRTKIRQQLTFAELKRENRELRSRLNK